MSSDRTMLWAARQQSKIKDNYTYRLFMAMAENADDEISPHALIACSVTSLSAYAKQERKTVFKGLKELKALGFIEPTNHRVGKTRRIIVYRLCIPVNFTYQQEKVLFTATTLDERWQQLRSNYPRQSFEDYRFKGSSDDKAKDAFARDVGEAEKCFKAMNNNTGPTAEEFTLMQTDLSSAQKPGGRWSGLSPIALPCLKSWLTKREWALGAKGMMPMPEKLEVTYHRKKSTTLYKDSYS
ncbi:MAG: hypothetical protein V4525_10880 [Pseudomonadota bacterium]